MQRYINTFLRYIWLFAIPLLITPAMVSQLIKPLPSYTVTAALWVEQPLYTEIHKNNDGAAYSTPAVNQADYLNELLHTREFLQQVSGTIIGKGFKMDEPTKALFESQLSKWFHVQPRTNHLITVQYSDVDRDLTLTTVQTIVNSFYDLIVNRIKEQGEGALKLFEGQVNDAKSDLDKAKNNVQEYITAHPGLVGATNSVGTQEPINNEDLTYSTLLQIQNNTSQRYELLNSQFEQVQVSYGAFLSGQDTIIKIKDEPVVSKSVTYNSLARTLVGLLLGLIAGALLAIFAVLIITWMDSSIHEKNYARKVFKNTAIVDLGEVQPVKGWRKRLPQPRRFCFRQSFGELLTTRN